MKVKNHKDFCCFVYESDMSNPNFDLGDVVTTETEDGIEIGVVIQLHTGGDIRTDMFGNASPSEVRLSSLDEIKKYRKDLLEHLEGSYICTMEATEEIKRAMKHVKDFYPNVSMVIFNKDCRWCFMDSDFNAPIFDERIDVSILDEAIDSVPYLPFIYEE